MSSEKPPRSVSPTFFPSLAFLLFGVALALAFVVASDKVGKSIGQFRQNRPEITVKGVATLDVRSGQGSLAGSISWRGEDFAAGRAAVAAAPADPPARPKRAPPWPAARRFAVPRCVPAGRGLPTADAGAAAG